MTKTTKLPWSVGADGKTIMGSGGDNFVLYASAKATCGRSDDDYYGCRSARAEVNLSIKPGDAALLVEAVNNHDRLTKRVEELEAALAAQSASSVGEFKPKPMICGGLSNEARQCFCGNYCEISRQNERDELTFLRAALAKAGDS